MSYRQQLERKNTTHLRVARKDKEENPNRDAVYNQIAVSTNGKFLHVRCGMKPLTQLRIKDTAMGWEVVFYCHVCMEEVMASPTTLDHARVVCLA